MPRRYRKDKRLAAVEETRRRIVDATMELHHRQGILATSWEDIARRADVALATVYRHFPTIEDLVPACGALTMSVIRPPRGEDARALFAGMRSLPARIERLADEFAAFYARSGNTFPIVLRDVDKVRGLQQFLAEHRATIETYVREALRPTARPNKTPAPPLVRLLCALFDYPLYKSLVDAGIAPADVARVLTSLATSQVARHRQT
jgi:AcrR family transcriptional regulator